MPKRDLGTVLLYSINILKYTFGLMFYSIRQNLHGKLFDWIIWMNLKLGFLKWAILRNEMLFVLWIHVSFCVCKYTANKKTPWSHNTSQHYQDVKVACKAIGSNFIIWRNRSWLPSVGDYKQRSIDYHFKTDFLYAYKVWI